MEHIGYEWQNIEISKSLNLNKLSDFLNDIWTTKYAFSANQKENTKQLFVNIEGNKLKARNFVGFIYFENEWIEIYPKIFAQTEKPTVAEKQNMIANLMYWLKYSQRLRFPFSRIRFESASCENLLEVFIHLFAQYSRELLLNMPYQNYEEITEETSFVKGNIHFPTYLSQQFSQGKQHIFTCTHQPFVYDNLFNQIVKATAKILLSVTQNAENKAILQEILFILSEVSDIKCSTEDCQKVKLGRMFDALQGIVEMCHFFLSMQQFSGTDSEKSNFCFLFPMEYIFEDFVTSILQEKGKKEGIKVIAQAKKHTKYLTNEAIFQLKPDILIPKKRIIDAKYKKLSLEKGKNYHINPADLYQMLAYATRFGIKDIILIYPQYRHFDSPKSFIFKIENSLSPEKEIVTIKIITIKIDFEMEIEKEYIENLLRNQLLENFLTR